jgi:hypothetical protein
MTTNLRQTLEERIKPKFRDLVGDAQAVAGDYGAGWGDVLRQLIMSHPELPKGCSAIYQGGTNQVMLIQDGMVVGRVTSEKPWSDDPMQLIRDFNEQFGAMREELLRSGTNKCGEAIDTLLNVGVGLELTERAEEMLGQTTVKAAAVPHVPRLFDNILEQLALRKITAAKFEPVPDRIVVPLSVESLQPKNVLEWVFGNQNDFWEATLMLDSEPLVNIVSEVEDDSKSESEVANFIAEVITHHEARIC